MNQKFANLKKKINAHRDEIALAVAVIGSVTAVVLAFKAGFDAADRTMASIVSDYPNVVFEKGEDGKLRIWENGKNE